MEDLEIWNNIVDLFNQNLSSEEFKIQELWERIFNELFNYKSLKGEITSHKTMMIGSTEKIITDVVLGKDNKDYVIVELKQECFDACSEKHFAQLISYLKQLKISIGILIANKINIIVYDYSKDDKEQQSIQIEFVKDNPLGEIFVNLFRKENLDKCLIENFINENCKNQNEKKELEKFINDEGYVKSILENYFKENGYNQASIDLLFNDYKINVVRKTTPHIPIPEPFPKIKKSCHKSTLGKYDAIMLCKKNGLFLSDYVTFANYNGVMYPANVKLNYLNHEWFILLNNSMEKKLHILKIPANTFQQSDFCIRKDNNLIVLGINSDFEDYHPYIGKINRLQQFLIKTIDYKEEI